MRERACARTVPSAPRGPQRGDGKTITTKRQRRALPEQQRQAGPAAFPRQRCRWVSLKPLTGSREPDGSQAPWLSHRHHAVTRVDPAASARRRERTCRQTSAPCRGCFGSALRLLAGKAAGDTGRQQEASACRALPSPCSNLAGAAGRRALPSPRTRLPPSSSLPAACSSSSAHTPRRDRDGCHQWVPVS